MKRYFSKKTHEEVKIGDKLITRYEEKTPTGIRKVEEVIRITPEVAETLVEGGFLEEEYEVCDQMSMKYYIEKLAKKQGWHYEKMAGFINKVFEINKTAALNMILKEIAITFDKYYEGHISKSDEIWVISASNGETVQVNKDKIACYKNIAAFRSSIDATTAWVIVKPLIMNMFTDEEEYRNIRIG